MKEKKSILKAQFNSIEVNQNDPTILTGVVIIHDFELSHNNQIITEEVCEENMNTLVGKRIVCNYIPCENNNGIDALTDHEDTIGYDRNSGQEILITNTFAIGFINEVYIDNYTDEQGNTKRVLYGKVVIWNDEKYRNIAGLLKEWIDRGINIHMSVEYLYYNYNFIDGHEMVQSPIIYTAHTLLNSENRGDFAEILPAYDSSQLLSLNDKKSWNKALNQLIKQGLNNVKESEIVETNKFLMSLNGLSFGDTRDKILSYLKNNMTAAEYEYVWLGQYCLFDNYFVYETYEDQKWVNYKVNYSKTENDEIIVDLESKQPATFKGDWVAITEYEQSQNSLNAVQGDLTKANETIEGLQSQLNTKDGQIVSLNEKLNTVDGDKQTTMDKFNELSETITALNSKVKEMQPIVDRYNQEQYEKSLNQAKEFYKEKFKGVDALEEFEKEEIQDLIKKSINSNEEAKEAKFSLNAKILDFITINKEQESDDSKLQVSLNSVTEPCKGTKNLRQDIDEFEATYGFKRD